MAAPKKDAHLNVRLPMDVKDRLYRLAEREDRPASWMVVKAIEEYLKKHENQPSG